MRRDGGSIEALQERATNHGHKSRCTSDQVESKFKYPPRHRSALFNSLSIEEASIIIDLPEAQSIVRTTHRQGSAGATFVRLSRLQGYGPGSLVREHLADVNLDFSPAWPTPATQPLPNCRMRTAASIALTTMRFKQDGGRLSPHCHLTSYAMVAEPALARRGLWNGAGSYDTHIRPLPVWKTGAA